SFAAHGSKDPVGARGNPHGLPREGSQRPAADDAGARSTAPSRSAGEPVDGRARPAMVARERHEKASAAPGGNADAALTPSHRRPRRRRLATPLSAGSAPRLPSPLPRAGGVANDLADAGGGLEADPTGDSTSKLLQQRAELIGFSGAGIEKSQPR